MEHAYKALEMAAGVLLGILIMSLIAYFFASISVLPQEEDMSENAEQLAKFNLEYEVYNKKIMYGVDVISCLNKAQSNNEKYRDGTRFLSGQKYGENYEINVKVTINSYLHETIEIYKYDKGKQTNELKTDTNPLPGVEMKHIFDIHDDSYSWLTPNSPVKKMDSELNGSEHIKPDIQYELVPTSNQKSLLAELLDFSNTNMRQVVTNSNAQTLEDWSTAIWETALYDLKTRRFKCEGITYSNITGRVNEIIFSEIADE